jgi:tRNA(fMet)-specific endonuclease VapC
VNGGVVVDTSVWLDFFAGRTTSELEAALRSGVVVLPPLVAAELVSGARRPRERAAIAGLLGELKIHDTPLEHWVRVGELRRRLRDSGLAVSTPDAHVAQCALDREALLLSRDTVFEWMAALCPLRLRSG